MEEKPISHTGHRDRLRDKYVKYGIDVFSPHEVIELALYYAIPRRDTNALAHQILEHFGNSLSLVFSASVQELEAVKGVGRNAAVLIKLFLDVANRVEKEKTSDKMKYINSYDAIGEYMRPFFFGKKTEVAMILLLDGTRKVLACKQLSEGGINSIRIDMKKLATEVFQLNAVYVAVAHNHPSGNAIPSQDDLQTTAYISDVLSKFNIVLIDHLIFVEDDYISLVQSKCIRHDSLGRMLFSDSAADEDCNSFFADTDKASDEKKDKGKT